MKVFVSLLALMCSFILYVAANPLGAPRLACNTLAPDPIAHGPLGASGPVPYSLNLTAFFNATTGVYGYYPGRTYNIQLTGNNGEQFRGFLVQARQVSDDSVRVGAFGGVPDQFFLSNVQLSSCTPPTDGVTHTNHGDKDSITLQWTAPNPGVGDIRFGFVVVERIANYWADQRTMVITQNSATGLTVTMGTLLSMVVLAMIKFF